MLSSQNWKRGTIWLLLKDGDRKGANVTLMFLKQFVFLKIEKWQKLY